MEINQIFLVKREYGVRIGRKLKMAGKKKFRRYQLKWKGKSCSGRLGRLCRIVEKIILEWRLKNTMYYLHIYKGKGDRREYVNYGVNNWFTEYSKGVVLSCTVSRVMNNVGVQKVENTLEIRVQNYHKVHGEEREKKIIYWPGKG